MLRDWTAPALLVTALVATALVGACGSSSKDAPQPATARTDEALFAAPAETTLNLEMRDVKFEPAQLEVKAGAVVELALRNVGDIEHDFSIERIEATQALRGGTEHGAHESRYAVHGAVKSKQTAQLRLRVPSAGSYEFFCSVPGHQAAGMRGTLVVR